MSTVHAHQPVLLQESLQMLALRPGGVYLDATFGRGGHSEAILQRLGPEGRVYALDRDPAAIAHAREAFSGETRLSVMQAAFSQLAECARSWGILGRVDGVLFDLGVSSPQLDDPGRGFSFLRDGPLDMRMDPNRGESAAQWLARASVDEIARVLRQYGEERFARRIARAIVATRREAPIETTGRLAEVVARAVPTREPGKHPATRTFQALRIQVNQELDEVARALPQALQVLAPGGRLAVISFHSLEDRLVKRFMQQEARGDRFPPDLPVPASALSPTLRLVGRAIRPSEAEVADNPRARSAVLRVAERLP